MTDMIEAMARAAQLTTGTPNWKWETVVHAALAAASQAGYVLVPREPSQEMQRAGGEELWWMTFPTDDAAEVYRAMIASAPKSA